MFKNDYLKVLGVLFRNPTTEFYIRELAKKAKVSPAFSKKVIDMLLSEKLITKRKRGNLVLVRANLDSLVFRYMKITYTLYNLTKVGLVDYLKSNVEELSSVVLFGSTARGEDSESSDMDLLIICTGSVNLSQLESLLKRKVSLVKYTRKEWSKKAKTDKAFYERILVDGIPLYGRLPIVR